MTTMTAPRALAALQDAIRAEILDELNAKLDALRADITGDTDEDEAYRAGIDDALDALRQAAA